MSSEVKIFTCDDHLEDCPLVSVVVPVYNHGKYVEYCLDSIRDQGYSNIEIIVIDDGSTDNSYLVLKKWQKENISKVSSVKIFRQDNLGVTKTLNKLIDLANGKYMLPIASDDAVLPGGIEDRVKLLESDLNLAVVIGDCEIIDGDNTITHASGLFDYKSYSRHCFTRSSLRIREMAIKWQLPGPVLFVRRSAYLDGTIGLYDEELLLEDRDLYLRLLAVNKMGYIDQAVTQYRIHVENTSLPVSVDNVKRTVHLTNTVTVENRYRRNFSGLAGLGVSLRGKIAHERIHILKNNGMIHRVKLTAWIMLIGSIYAFHRIASRVTVLTSKP